MVQVESLGLPKPLKQVRLIPGRKFLHDFAWPDAKVAVEINGGTWNPKMAHSGGAGYERDCEKQFLAVLNGWWPLNFTGPMVRDGRAAEMTERLLKSITRRLEKKT